MDLHFHFPNGGIYTKTTKSMVMMSFSNEQGLTIHLMVDKNESSSAMQKRLYIVP